MKERGGSTRDTVPALATILSMALSGSALAQTETDAALQLPDAVRQALAWHPELRSTTAAIDRALGALDQARSERWPQLALRAFATQFQEPMIVAPLHEFDSPPKLPARPEVLRRPPPQSHTPAT